MNVLETDTAQGLFDLFLIAKKKFIEEKKIIEKKDKHTYPIKNTAFEIPKNWVWCYLSDLSIIQEGPGIRKYQYENEGVQFLTVTNILEGSVDLNKSKKYISISEYEEKYKHFTIDKGDIVTACSGGSWGKSSFYDLNDEIILNTSTLRLRFFNDLGDNKYLYYLTKTSYFKGNLSSHSTGQQANYGYSHYSKIPVPLPPLNQQQQIVSIIDKAFAAIDTAKANTEENLQNAKELFESYLQNVFEHKGDDWEEKKLSEVTKVLNGHSFKSKDFSSENSVKSIKITNVGVKEFIQTEDNYLPSSFSDTYNKYRVHKGNLVIALTRTIISSGLKVAVVPDEYDNSLLNQRVAALIPKDVINDDYLYHFFCTKIVSDYVLSNVNPLMQPNLSITDLKKLLIPCPSLQEQKKVVQKLNDLTAQTKKLESIYTQKLADLEEMKKSVLQKAFSGQLNTIN
jgi:type I restriction enzyme S subunit